MPTSDARITTRSTSSPWRAKNPWLEAIQSGPYPSVLVAELTRSLNFSCASGEPVGTRTILRRSQREKSHFNIASSLRERLTNRHPDLMEASWPSEQRHG